MNGGGGAEKEGGGGGAELGGGGTSISPWRRSGTESILPFGRFVVLPVPFILGSMNGGRTGTLGVGTAKPCTLSEDVKCLTVGRERTLAVPDSGMAAESNTSSTLSMSLNSTLVPNRD